ncbi:hyaluronidase A-like isoform X2 [Maniola jurtina]|uniref:hyaluronidase A-like isoform X2 n=1 Tax=Maniola jurtina TaxID=191418 RepID=UPI001E6882F4|nr:hyaluronidase A-like isoform X2 [Maniola jurtina]
MLLFLFFVLVCCTVRCDYVSNNYYIIEMPEAEIAKDYNTPFKVYWNVPTGQCRSRKVTFDNLAEFGIIQNQDDSFEGGRVTIMYDPGVFPAIFKGASGKYRYRNGGVPQQGNLELHLTAFRESLNKSIPNPNFSGVGVIDFESWRPIFRQQFGTLTPYVDLSMSIERKKHWWWPAAWQKMEATKRFEDAARIFMQTTLSIAKQMRPNAIWGYYAYPYCFNIANNAMENCSDLVKGENDKIYWLWAESTALYPSVYSSVNLSTSQLAALVRGRITEANRVKKAGSLVLPYFWYRYRDAGFMSEVDVTAVLEALKKTNASGLIIWGSSSDVNSLDKCNELYNYVENKLGPIIKKYVQQINRNYDETIDADFENNNEYNDSLVSTTEATTTLESLNEIETTTNDFFTIGIYLNLTSLPQNSSKNTSNDEEEQSSASNKGAGSNNETDSKTLNESSLWDILKNQFNFGKRNKQTTRSINKAETSVMLKENDVESDFKNAATFDEISTQHYTINIEDSSTERAIPENVLISVLDIKSDDSMVTVENNTYHINRISAESIDNLHNENGDLIKVLNLKPPTIVSVNTKDDKSITDTFTETLTDSSENFFIIKEEENKAIVQQR